MTLPPRPWRFFFRTLELASGRMTSEAESAADGGRALLRTPWRNPGTGEFFRGRRFRCLITDARDTIFLKSRSAHFLDDDAPTPTHRA